MINAILAFMVGAVGGLCVFAILFCVLVGLDALEKRTRP